MELWRFYASAIEGRHRHSYKTAHIAEEVRQSMGKFVFAFETQIIVCSDDREHLDGKACQCHWLNSKNFVQQGKQPVVKLVKGKIAFTFFIQLFLVFFAKAEALREVRFVIWILSFVLEPQNCEFPVEFIPPSRIDSPEGIEFGDKWSKLLTER